MTPGWHSWSSTSLSRAKVFSDTTLFNIWAVLETLNQALWISDYCVYSSIYNHCILTTIHQSPLHSLHLSQVFVYHCLYISTLSCQKESFKGCYEVLITVVFEEPLRAALRSFWRLSQRKPKSFEDVVFGTFISSHSRIEAHKRSTNANFFLARGRCVARKVPGIHYVFIWFRWKDWKS